MDERHKDTLRHIENYIEENGFPPTVRELAELLGMKSTSTIQRYLEILEKEGYIERRTALPRAIKVINKS